MKEMIKKVREEKDGFTIAELLIVVAIIAVLVAIAIPVFTAQLNEARYGTDQANARSIYGELRAAELTDTKVTVSSTSVTAGSETTITVTSGTDANATTNVYKFSGLTGVTIQVPDKANNKSASVTLAEWNGHAKMELPMTAGTTGGGGN